MIHVHVEKMDHVFLFFNIHVSGNSNLTWVVKSYIDRSCHGMTIEWAIIIGVNGVHHFWYSMSHKLFVKRPTLDG